MGAIEEGGKAATGVIDALKSQPLNLAMLIINLALLTLLYVSLDRASKLRSTDLAQMHIEQKEVRELLARCIVPDRRSP
jgi:hypothetical protein